MMRYALLILILCGTFVQAQTQSKKIVELEHLLARFEYQTVLQKGTFLLSDAYTTHNDSLKIYPILINASYQLYQESEKTKTIILTLLKIAPNYAPEPSTTSPKIIRLIESLKPIPLLNNAKRNEVTAQIKQKEGLPTPAHLSQIILPGTGYFYTNNPKQAWYETTASTLLLSGLIYSSIETYNREEAYLNARSSQQFNSRYSSYNKMYKTRNVLIGTYLLWWLYSNYNFYESNVPLQLQFSPHQKSINLSLDWHL